MFIPFVVVFMTSDFYLRSTILFCKAVTRLVGRGGGLAAAAPALLWQFSIPESTTGGDSTCERTEAKTRIYNRPSQTTKRITTQSHLGKKVFHIESLLAVVAGSFLLE
jgi:hypothetical protein